MAKQIRKPRRELATAHPDRYRPDLAQALTMLGVMLAEADRPGALPVSEEAVTIYRELGATNPDRYYPGLAISLNNLGIRYSGLGQTTEALPPTEEAVTIYRKLATANPIATAATSPNHSKTSATDTPNWAGQPTPSQSLKS